MLIQNVTIENSQLTSDLRIQDGKFAEIAPKLQPLPQEETIDMGGKLMLPPFIESHVHLDTCLTAGGTGTTPEHCLKELSAGTSARKCSLV